MKPLVHFTKLFSQFSRNSVMLIALFVLLATSGYSQRNYPFPQNYQYPHGQIYSPSNAQQVLQGLYNSWLANYYEEGNMTGGPMSGTPAARIKFVQPGESGNAAVSEGIVYGLLIMVYMDNATNNTRNKFDRLWNFYKANSDQDGVMHWKVDRFTGQPVPGAGNSHGATDAELDAAQALLMAYKQWGDVYYLNEAKTLINTIWLKETFIYNGKRYLKPGNMFQDYLNPCYFITNAMQLFEHPQINPQPSYNWSDLINNSYDITMVTRHQTTGLVPDWCWPDGSHLNGILHDKFESYFLYDAIRMPWRMAHAYAWYGHEKARDIAAKMTDWAITALSGNPANAVDGYFLNGQPFTSTHPNFSQLGKHHNPCFTGGLGIGAMVGNSPAYQQFLERTWIEASKTDPWGHYYTHTTQLLYLLTLTGNMPNFWDMKPVFDGAETNANGTQVIVNFTKAITSASASASTASWTVSTYASDIDPTPTNIPVFSVQRNPANTSQLILTLSDEIAEPFIYVSYNGTVLRAQEDNAVVDPFGPEQVLNRITNLEPFPENRFTDILGTQVKIQWTREIDPTSINPAHFTVRVNGSIVPVTGATRDAEDFTIVNIAIDGGIISSSADEVTVSFAGGSIRGIGSSKNANAFTNQPVQNFYLSVECYMIDDFDPPQIAFSTWGNATWSSTASDPTGAQAGNVGRFVASTTPAGDAINYNAKGVIPNHATFNTAISSGNNLLKFRMYVSGLAAGKNIRIRIYEELDPATPNYWGKHMLYEFQPTSLNAWHEYEFDLSAQFNPSNIYNNFLIQASPDEAGAETIYIDDIRVCPPDPVVDFVNGRTTYDGSQIEIRFTTAMRVPDPSEFQVYSGVSSIPVTAVHPRQGDATILVLTLATPIDDPLATIMVSGGASPGLRAVDGRQAEYFTGTIVNLYNISVTTGWRDDFNDAADYVTDNIGVGTAYTDAVEVPTGDGLFRVTMNGELSWASLDVTTWTPGPGLKQVMDLTGREIVQIRYRTPNVTGRSPSLYLRIDCKDKTINERVSDGMDWLQLPISTTWNEVTINLSSTFFSQYGSSPGPVDRTSIYQVMFYFVENTGTAPSWIPKNFNGIIEFDFISIGSALLLTNVSPSVNQGSPVSATSNADGRIFLVPGDTPPTLQALQDSVFAGVGAVVDCINGVPASISTIGLKAGYYEAYAYNPVAGAISAKVGLNILDVTPPIFIDFSSGNIPESGVVSVTVNEGAWVYVIPATGTFTSIAQIIDNSYYTFTVEENIAAAVNMSDLIAGARAKDPSFGVGSQFRFIAVDYAYPIGNISQPTGTPVTIANAPLTMFVNPTGIIEQGDEISVTTSRAATAYLVPSSQSISTTADLTAHAVSTATISGTEGVILTSTVAEGEYFVYVSDGTTIIGPSARITVQISNIPVVSISAIASVSVAKDASTDVLVSFSPSNASSFALDLTFTASLINATYNEATQTITITGVNVTSVPTQLTLTSNPDNRITTIEVTVTCPTTAPLATQVPNVTTCSLNPDPLVATLGGTAEAVWYAGNTGGPALFTGNTYNHGQTAGLHTYYVAQIDNGCESATRRAVSLTINANPTPSITNAPASMCTNDPAITLTATPAGGTWSGAITTASFNPSVVGAGSRDVTYTVTQSGCTGSTSETILVQAAPTITNNSMPTEICRNAAPITLSSYVTPATGTFTLDGTPITVFDPSTQTVGNKTITYTVSQGGCEATQNFVINVKAVPNAAITGLPASICIGAAPLNLTNYVTVAGTFSDNLSNVSGTTFTPTNTGTSTITHSVTASGCTGTATADITVNPLPTITPVSALCTNAPAITLTATPTGGTFSGTGVSGTQFNPATAGVGTHTVTYTAGCATTTDIIVNTAATPTVNNISVEVDGTPEAFVATGATGTITWYTDAALTNQVGTGSTYTSQRSTASEGTVHTYYITNTENGCTSPAVTATVTVTSCSTPAPTFVSSAVVCLGDAIPALTATGTDLKWYSSTNDLLYSGNNFDATAHVIGTGVTTFSVTQTDGCEGTSATATVTINALPANPIVTNASVCQGAPAIALTATGTNISWENASNVEVGTGNSYTPTVTTVGAHSFFAIAENAQGCKSARVEAIYTILANPAAPTVTPVSACEGSAITPLQAVGSNIRWYDSESATTSIASGASYTTTQTTAGVYTYYATQRVGDCESPKASGAVTIHALPTVSISGPATACIDAGTVSFTAAPTGGTLTGSTGITGTSLNPVTAGSGLKTLTYAYTDGNNCSSSATHEITIYETAAPTASDQSIQVDDPIPALTATGTGTISWYNATQTVVLFTGASFTPTSIDNSVQGVHTFRVTNTENGCESEPTTVTLTITSCSTPAPTVTNASVCSGQTIPALTATGTSIIWYNDAGDQVGTGTSYTPTVSAPGVYEYFASQTIGCEGPQTRATLTIRALPSISLNAIPSVCSYNAPVSLASYATPTGGTWSGEGVSANTFTPSQALAGTKTLTYTYTDANNCVNTEQTTIIVNHTSRPTVTNSPITVNVDVTPEPFVATGTNIRWYADETLLSNIGNGEQYQASARSTQGVYTFYVTQEANNCVSNAQTATLNVTSCTTPLPANVTVSNSICAGEAIPAFTAEGTDLKWYNQLDVEVGTGASFIPTVSNTIAAEHTFFVSQTVGCEGPRQQVTLTVNALPTVTFSAVAALCTTDPAINLATYVSPAGGTYSGDITSATVNPATLGEGSYNVIYTYSNGTCENTASRTITINNCGAPDVTTINITPSVSINVGETSQLTIQILPAEASQNVTWQIGNPAIISVTAGGLIEGLAAGSTTIQAVAADGSGTVSNICNVTVSDVVVPVESVTFTNIDPIVIFEGQTVDISQYVQVNPAGATSPVITYQSLDPTRATVNAAGVVTAASSVPFQVTATITVTVTAGGVTRTANLPITINRQPVLVNGIVIPTSSTITEGGTRTLTATVSPSNADNTTVTWSISGGTGATINASTGQITATGTAGQSFTVIATANDASGIVSNECVVTILQQDVPLSSMTVNVSSVSLTKDGRQTITITFNPANTTQTDLTIEVGQSGVVGFNKISDTEYELIGLQGGTQQVIVRSASNTSLFSAITVTVTEYVSNISVTAAGSATSVNIGGTLQLQAHVLPATATNKAVSWASSDETVATVSETGLVSALTEGPVIISAVATDGSFEQGSISLTVTKIPVNSITVSNLNANNEIEVGNSMQITYTVSPANATFAAVTFSSSDESIATIDENGVITAISSGDSGQETVVITVTPVDNPSLSQSIIVKVIPRQADKYLLQQLYDYSFGVYEDVQLGKIVVGYNTDKGEISPINYNRFLTDWGIAQTVLYNRNATQEEVDQAFDRLYAALLGLNVTPPTVIVDEVTSIEVSIYPTIMSTSITIESYAITSVTIIDMKGTVVDAIPGKGSQTVTVDVTAYAQGIYTVVVETPEATVSQKVIK